MPCSREEDEERQDRLDAVREGGSAGRLGQKVDPLAYENPMKAVNRKQSTYASDWLSLVDVRPSTARAKIGTPNMNRLATRSWDDVNASEAILE